MNTELDWQNLKFFLALAKEGRLQKAAVLLGSNHSTVYRRIRAFEQEIQTRLFESTPSGYHLTSAGERILQVAGDLEERMDELSRAIAGVDTSLGGQVNITTTNSLSSTVLPAVFARLKKRWPGISINLKVSNQHFNLSKREADIAIRPSSDVPLYLMGRRLGWLKFGVYAAREYLEEHPGRAFLKNLPKHHFIGLDDSLNHLLSKQWLDKILPADAKIYRTDNLLTSGNLCQAGMGVAVLPHYFANAYPNLERVYQPAEKLGSDLWLLTHKDLAKTPKIKAVMDFLFQDLKKCMKKYVEQ